MPSQARMKLYHELRYFAQRRVYLGPCQTFMNFNGFFKTVILMVILYTPTPQNGQTLSNNSLLQPTNCSSVFDHFVGLARRVNDLMVPLAIRNWSGAYGARSRFHIWLYPYLANTIFGHLLPHSASCGRTHTQDFAWYQHN